MTISADLLLHSSWIWLMGAGLLLGALHALEPGHAKTMMASFIVATRGTVPQAALLGLSAAVSHSALIWILAIAGLAFGDAFIGDDAEPWLELASGAVIVLIGLSMVWRRMDGPHRERLGPKGGPLVDVGDGFAEIAIFEDGVPPEFRIFVYDRRMRRVELSKGEPPSVQTIRPDGRYQTFPLVPRDGFWVSPDPIPEPHEFTAILTLSQRGRVRECEAAFVECDHHHDHDHDHSHPHRDEDAHARAHSREIAKTANGQPLTMPQVVWFGLGSGLMPCPAALTMLLVCLRMKKIALGVGVVTAFSLGLAATLMALGVIAALGVAHASRRLPSFGRFAGALPYLSSALVVALGVFMAASGLARLG